MAITTLQTPDILTPSSDPILFTHSSTLSNLTGFRYKYDIKTKDGVIATKRLFPFPNDIGRIDLSSVLYNYTHSYFNPTVTGTTDTIGTLIQYSLDTSSTGSTSSETVVDSLIRYCFNGSDEDFNFSDFMLLDADNLGKFLTNSPLTIPISLTDYYTFNYFNGQFSGYTYVSYSKYMRIAVYNQSDTRYYTIWGDNYNYEPGGSLQNVDMMLKMTGVGPMNLNNDTTLFAVDALPLVQPIIHSGTNYYEVWMMAGPDEALGTRSVTYRFNVNHLRRRYGNHQIAFLNRLGTFSYITLTGKMKKSVKSNSDTYIKNKYYLDEDNKWVTNNSRRGETIYNSKYYSLYTFNSDYLDQDTFNFMEELFTSSEIYYLSELEGFIPIIIEDTSWESKTKDNEKVISFTLNCRSANQKKINI